MSEDLTRRFDGQEDSEKLTQILAILQSLGTHVQSLDAGVENLDTHVQSLDTHVENVDKLVGSIGERLGDLEQKVDLRPYDTRPIWEKVQTDIIQLQEVSSAFRKARSSYAVNLMRYIQCCATYFAG